MVSLSPNFELDGDKGKKIFWSKVEVLPPTKSEMVLKRWDLKS